MRNGTAWAAAALVAATGCGGSATNASSPASPEVAADGHEGENEACLQCKVTGGGVFFLNGQRVTFGLNAIPQEGTGFGGSGTAAVGHIELQLHDSSVHRNIFGRVDTIVGCSRVDHVLFGTFAGELRDGVRFEVTVSDAGEPGRADTIAFTDDVSFGPIALEPGGNLKVHDLESCANSAPPPPPPTCDQGMCMGSSGQCEPCTEQPPFIPM